MVLQEVRTQGGTSTTTTFLYGLGLISVTDEAGVTSYYLPDGLGSTTQLASTAGTVTDSYAYDVFGAIRSSTGTTANDFRFTGEQNDYGANRGLYNLRARYYDPALGRFLNRDPLPLIQRYGYVGNNPIAFTDPSGQFPCPLCRQIVQAVDCVTNATACALKAGLNAFMGSPVDKELVDLAGAAAARAANSSAVDKEGGIRLIENCDSPFCRALFASAGVGVDQLQALTIGDTILAPGVCDFSCFQHESVHVQQYRELGFVGFMYEYFGKQSAKNAFKCVGKGTGFFNCLYDNNALEKEAGSP